MISEITAAFLALVMYLVGLCQGWAWAKGYDNWIRNWMVTKMSWQEIRRIWREK